jgi:glycerol-3-phosphate dehydrogenase
MAGVLGWSKRRTETEIERYLARVDAELASQQQRTDEAADRVRLGAPEPSA